jgi:riboflavin kinase/FMN adenylyltransferase
VRLLTAFGARHAFEVIEVPWLEIGGQRVSSTAIRAMLREGDVVSAADLLGRHYFADGEVVAGAGRGAGLGVPTANIATVNELLPAPGIYAGRASLEGRTYAAAVFVGQAVTFGATAPVFEAHLVDFAGGDVHGAAIRVTFAERLRPVRKFGSPQALADQMRRDIEAARRAFQRAQDETR